MEETSVYGFSKTQTMNKVCTHIGIYGQNDIHGIIIEEQSGFSMKLSLIKQTDSTQSTIEGLLGQLNPTQRQAAETTDGPVLIIAGAGSGKTRVLTFRVAHLIQKGVLPQSILALTFTNKAASEMKSRISALVDPLLAKKVWAGTFHSIFARILRIEAELIGYDSTFSIYDADDSLSIIRACMNYAGVSTQQITAQSIRGKISHAKNQMIGWQQFSADAASINDRLAAKVYQEYEKRLKANNAMDFDDILLSMIHVLRLFPDVRDKYNDRFRYVMVDEYQDTNRAQYTAIRLLTEKHSNICVVGDDAQSIYRWRGADIRNILEFQKDYPEVKTIRLEQNYRSTKTILDAANGVIKNNRKQLKKTIWTDNNEGELITVMPAETERDEAEMIVNSIQSEIRRNDYEYKDFAVLYRTNAQSQPLEESFRRNALPYTIIGGMSFYKRKEVKDTMAYLRLLINTRDAESVERVLNVPPRGIGDTSLKKIEEYAAMQSISLYEALTENNAIPSLQPRTKKSVNGFIALIEKYRELLSELPLVDVIQTYIEATGITRMYSDEGTEEAQDRLRNIEQILATVAEYAEEEEEPTLEGFLQQFSLMADADDTDLSKDSIALMTLHAAKGLEFPVVFIAGMEQGLFPLGKAMNDPEEEEEERRLLYVGITRAEKKIYISHASRRYKFGQLEFSLPSRFLGEIPENLLENTSGARSSYKKVSFSTAKDLSKSINPAPKINPPSRGVAPYHQKSMPVFDDIPQQEYHSQIPHEQKPLKVGAKVKHPTFGYGTVRGVAGVGKDRQATVSFTSVGVKKLLLEYAKLEVVG